MYERYFGTTNIKKPLSLLRKSDDLKPFSDRLQLREEIDSSKAERRAFRYQETWRRGNGSQSYHALKIEEKI